MVATGSNETASRAPLRQMLKNVVWLIGGKGFGAVCSLIYLAILTRTLGLKDFGHFSLIFGTSQALIALVSFQTWQTVVRYGAEHVHKQEWNAFGRLAVLAGVLDVTGAIFGTVIAWIVFYQFAEALNINPNLVDIAFWFNVAALWALVSAPTGIVRALNRFDVAVFVEAVVPIGRLICALAIWATGPSLVRFLIAWAAIDILEAIVYWIMARWLCPKAVRLSHMRHLRRARSENPGIVRFFSATYATATLNAAYRHGPLLAVGALIGTSAAGLYRLAQQLALALAKLSTLLSRAAYAEIARARVASAADQFRKLAMQTSKIASAVGAIVVLIVVLIGQTLLEGIAGDQFGSAYVILIPLTIAASLELASVAFEPVLHSTGRASYSLIARTLTVIATAVAIIALTPLFEAPGAAWAVVLGGVVGYLAIGGMALRAMTAIEQTEQAAQTPAG